MIGTWNIWRLSGTEELPIPEAPLKPMAIEIEFDELQEADLDRLFSAGAERERDQRLLSAADMAWVGRNPEGDVVCFGCAALHDFSDPSIPFPIQVDTGEAYTHHGEVGAEWRRIGIGRHFLRFRLTQLKRAGITSVFSHVAAGNATQETILSRNGFRHLGVM